MTITLTEFRRQAETRGICSMSRDWDKCATKKQLIDLCLSIRGVQYVAKAIGEGWGISPDVIVQEFSPFLNGVYSLKDPAGYTSTIWCGKREERATIASTVALIVDWHGEIFIPANHICELHIVKSDVSVIGEGRAKAYLYDSRMINRDTASAVIMMEQ